MTKLKRKNDENMSSNTKKSRDDEDGNDDNNDNEMEIGAEEETGKVKAAPAALAESSSDSDDDSDDNDDDSASEVDVEEDTEEGMFEAGQIMKVYVENFMNHKCFEINFGRKLNFITGANGSGKSAIVAALQLCLGVNARKTGRANNLAKLIRQGHDGNAIIRVTLLNEGPDAYRPETYGNRITIERTISRSGGGSYKIMDVKSNKVSGERRELDSIMRTFNIYCDNPCNVLTQEESKRFINGKEEDKYKFFLKATGLDRTQEEIDFIVEQMAESKKRIETQRKRLGKKEEVVLKYAAELKKFKNLDELEFKLKKLAAKALMVEERDQKCVVDIAEKEVEKRKKENEKNQDRLKKLQDMSSQEEDESNDVDEIQSESLKLEEAQEAKAKAIADFMHSKDMREACKNDIKKANKVLSDYRANESRLKKDQAAAQAKLDNSAQSNEQPLLAKIKNIQAEIDQELVRKNQLETLKRDLDAEVEEAEVKVRTEKQNLSAELKHISDLDRNLQNTKRSSDNTAAINTDLPKVLVEMKKMKFKAKVVGPIGKHVKIKDEYKERFYQIERGLDSLLSTFVVTDIQDQRSIGQLLRRLKVQKINIIKTSASSRYPTSEIPDALRLIDAVVVDDDLVYNVILDRADAARVVLVKNEDEHRRYLDASGSFKHNIKSVLDFKANKIEVKNGNKRTMADRSMSKNKKLVSDVAEIITGLQNEIQLCKTQEAEIRAKYGQATREQKTASNNSHKVKADLMQIQKKIRGFNGDIRRTEEQLEELRAERNEDNLIAITQELKELEDAIAGVLPKIEEIQSDLDKCTQEEKVFKIAKTKAEDDMAVCRERLDRLIEQVREKKELQKKAKKNLEVAEKEAKNSEVNLTRAEQILEPQKKLLEERKNRAEDAINLLFEENGGEPVNVKLRSTDTHDSIKQQTEKENAKLKEKKAEIGLGNKTREQVQARLEDAEDDLQRSRDEIQRMDNEIGTLNNDAELRRKRMKDLRKTSSKTIKKVFNEYLANKKCKGSIKFCHKERKLSLAVQTDNHDEGSRATDVRQLSGGERSYTTLCLLLALGHVIECPFRLMDEYDVFLDQMSRRITLAQLQQHALQKEQQGRQFLVITPQTLDDVRTSNDVRVHRVKPPIRGGAHELQQSTLTFSN